MSLTATINNITVVVLSAKKSKTIDGRSVLTLVVRDDSGSASWIPGQEVVLTDSLKGVEFTGFISTNDYENLYPNPTNQLTLAIVDDHYLADKRSYAGIEFENRYAGDNFVEIIQTTLSAEGVQATYSVDRDTSQTDFNSGTLSGLIPTSNNGGDLELVASGTQLANVQSGVTIPTMNALKFVGTASQGYSNAYVYQKIYVPGSSTTLVSGDFLTYDIWIQSDSPAIIAGVDISFTDGTSFRDFAGNGAGTDSQGLYPHPNHDLSGYANDQWYNRQFGVSGTLIGKTIAYFTIAFEGESNGTYTAYFRRISWMNGATTKLAIFGDATTAPQSNSQISNSGYSNVSVSVVAAHDKSYSVFYNKDLSQVKNLKNSYITYDPNKLNIASDAQYIQQHSIDVGASRQLAVNGAAIPNLLPGSNLNGHSFFTWKYVVQGKDPTASKVIPDTAYVINSAPPNNGTSGVDVSQKWDLNTEWNAGTFSSTKSGGTSNLLLSGYAVPFATTADYNGIVTIFGAGGGFAHILQSTILLDCNATSETRMRLDSAGSWSDGTIEVDIEVHTGVLAGVVYRTTNWNSVDSTWAYAVQINTTQLTFNRGSNAGSSGSSINIATASLNLTTDTWHRLKVIATGSNHQIFIDDVRYVNATDATFSAAGQIALRNRNTTAATFSLPFKNFGVLNNALSGTWLSQAVSIAGAVNYGSSLVAWDNSQDSLASDGLTYIPQGGTILVESTVDGGTTWLACTNGAAIPGLTAGQSLASKSVQFRVTLSTTSATAQPTLGGLSFWLVPPYSSTGYRIAPPLSLNNISRAGSTLVSWNGSQPTNTNIYVDSSLDGSTFTNIGGGASGMAPISGITTQPEPVLDDYFTDTSANYTSSFLAGGSAATWTWSNNRVNASGGSGAYLAYNTAFIGADIDLTTLMDYSDGGGLFWRLQDTSNLYDLVIHDGSAASNPNTIQVFSVVAGVRTQLGSNVAISFGRGTPHVIRSSMIGNVITVYFDGNIIYSMADSNIAAAGRFGLRNDPSGGGSTARFYFLRFQSFGDILSGKQAYTKVRLSTSDPTTAPALFDIITSARDTNIQNGAFIASTNYSVLNGSKNTTAQDFDDLAKQSDYYWTINNTASLKSRIAVMAPFALAPLDVQEASIKLQNADDNYRNSEWLNGGTDSVYRVETFIGDGNSQSWNLAYPVDSIVSMGVNSNPATYAVKGQAGKDYYYQQGSNTIAQDTSETALNEAQVLTVTYYGLVPITVNVKRDSAVVARSLIDNTSGIIEVPEDAPGLDKPSMIVLADSRLTQFCKSARTITFETLRDGLEPGQLASFFLPSHQLNSDLFLITQVDKTWQIVNINGVVTLQSFYTVSATEGAIIGDWARWFVNALN